MSGLCDEGNKRAVNRLPGVESCRISVSDGSVEVSQDISNGTVSRVSSVLSSLGHDLILVAQKLLEYLLHLFPQDLELTPRDSENGF